MKRSEADSRLDNFFIFFMLFGLLLYGLIIFLPHIINNSKEPVVPDYDCDSTTKLCVNSLKYCAVKGCDVNESCSELSIISPYTGVDNDYYSCSGVGSYKKARSKSDNVLVIGRDYRNFDNVHYARDVKKLLVQSKQDVESQPELICEGIVDFGVNTRYQPVKLTCKKGRD